MQSNFTFPDPECIGHPIGFGAHATVKEYKDKDDSSQHANIHTQLVVKIATQLQFSPNIDREWIVGSHLQASPNLIHLFNYGKIDSTQCSAILMPKLGQDLANVTKTIGGQFTLQSSLLIGLELLTGITEIHKSGFIHCDIKPV